MFGSGAWSDKVCRRHLVILARQVWFRYLGPPFSSNNADIFSSFRPKKLGRLLCGTSFLRLQTEISVLSS